MSPSEISILVGCEVRKTIPFILILVNNAAGLWQGERYIYFIVINVKDRKVRTSNLKNHRLIGTITQTEGGTLIRQTERRNAPLQLV